MRSHRTFPHSNRKNGHSRSTRLSAHLRRETQFALTSPKPLRGPDLRASTPTPACVLERRDPRSDMSERMKVVQNSVTFAKNRFIYPVVEIVPSRVFPTNVGEPARVASESCRLRALPRKYYAAWLCVRGRPSLFAGTLTEDGRERMRDLGVLKKRRRKAVHARAGNIAATFLVEISTRSIYTRKLFSISFSCKRLVSFKVN